MTKERDFAACSCSSLVFPESGLFGRVFLKIDVFILSLPFIFGFWMTSEHVKFILCVCAPLCPTLCNPMDHQACLSMAFSRQECWSGLPFPPPGDLPNPGIEPKSPTFQADSLPTEPPRKPSEGICHPKICYFRKKFTLS